MTVVSSAARAAVESLERRLLLTIALDGTQVVITGDDGDNHIVITRNGKTPATRYTVAMDDEVAVFEASAVTSFRVDALGGNDLISVDSTRGIITLTRFVDCGDGDDTFLGSAGQDRVVGGNGNDLLVGGNGRDVLDGGPGADTVSGGADSDLLVGGSGDDLIIGSDGNDTIMGGSGNDSISAGDQDDLVYGGPGDDTILGSRGDDALFGGDDDDTIDGGAGNDLIVGGDGNDTMSGAGGHDQIVGDDEGFLVTATTSAPQSIGNDILSGANGDDTLIAHSGSDTLTGGGGTDWFDPRGSDKLVTDKANNESISSEQVFVGTPGVSIDVTLTILAGSEQVLIPAGAGVFSGGTSIARVISVDGNGTATVRFSDLSNRSFVLGEFFRQWGVPFSNRFIGQHVVERGVPLTMTVNGAGNDHYQHYAVNDGDAIVIRYGRA